MDREPHQLRTETTNTNTMKHNYTNTQLQSAIDEACDKLAQSTRVYLNALDLDNTTESWPVEAPARLDLIKSALAALPEPEPPTVDWKAKAERVEHERNGWSQMHGDMKVRAEKAEAELDRVREACDRMSEQEVLSRSQLRPLAEAGEVPEGCVRYYTYKKDGDWTSATKHRAMQVTHYIDIPHLPAPAEKPNPKPVEPLVTKPISLPLAESMSLRDWFAGQAMAGLLTQPAEIKFGSGHFAKASYEMADAMLAAREEDAQ
jgi:hypothetical protein